VDHVKREKFEKCKLSEGYYPAKRTLQTLLYTCNTFEALKHFINDLGMLRGRIEELISKAARFAIANEGQSSELKAKLTVLISTKEALITLIDESKNQFKGFGSDSNENLTQNIIGTLIAPLMSLARNEHFNTNAFDIVKALNAGKIVVINVEALSNATVESLNNSILYELSKCTIYRDVNRLNFFPIELRDGIVYLEEGYDIAAPVLEHEELLIAELAFSSIAAIDETTDKKLHTLRAKLSTPLFFNPYTIKAESFEAMNRDSELCNKIEDAIKQRNVSKVTNNQIVSEVDPYKLVAFDGIWYLLARDKKDEKIKTYLVAHIEEFRASAKCFSDSYTDIDKLLENVHTAWFEDGNNFVVKVKVKKEIAHYFKLKKHLNSQEIFRENSDGSLVVTFKVSCDEDVDKLIKAWLPHVAVISPLRLRNKITAELEQYIYELKKSSAQIEV